MTDGNGAAVDVDDVRVPAHVLVDRAGLGGEGLVGLDEVEVARGPSGLFQRLARSRDRSRAHDRRIDAGRGPGDDAHERRDATTRRFRLAHQERACGAIIDARRVAGRDRAVLVEGRLQLLHRLDRCAVADIFVLVDDGVALAALDRHGDDLVLEPAGLLGGLGLVLRGQREPVLVLAGDLVLLGDVLGRVAHMIAVEGIPQPVLDHRVDQLGVAHLDAGAQVLGMRRQRHRFLAACDDDLRIAGGDLLHAECDGPQPRAADLVEAPGGRLLRQSAADRSLACRVLSLRRGQHLAEDDLVDLARLDAGTDEQVPDDGGAEFVAGRRGESAVEGTDRSARGAGDDD